MPDVYNFAATVSFFCAQDVAYSALFYLTQFIRPSDHVGTALRDDAWLVHKLDLRGGGLAHAVRVVEARPHRGVDARDERRGAKRFEARRRARICQLHLRGLVQAWQH